MSQKVDDSFFEIYIDFTKNEGDPTRIFKTMTSLINSIQNIDTHLATTLNIPITTELLLEEIQGGSIKAKFRSVINSIPDEALKKGDIKPIIGHFLLQGKHKILEWCAKRETIENREEVKKLQYDILQLAEKTNLTYIKTCIPFDEKILLTDIYYLQDSLLYLEATDDVKLISNEVESTFNKKLKVTAEIVKEMITRETISSESTKILKVKKVDFLGSSKWTFKYENQTYEAKILNTQWLQNYQNRLIELHPGDSMKVMLIEETSYGYNNEAVHIDYLIKDIIEILPTPKLIRGKLF